MPVSLSLLPVAFTRRDVMFAVNSQRFPDRRLAYTANGTELTFIQSEPDAPFDVSDHTPRLEEVFRYLSDLDEHYKKVLQAMIYGLLKKRSTNRQITLEQEEVLDDHSIVIALNVER
ncbi:hypothetical protein [Paenibacillus senegalensis]|uniref:hypothetical protein n=1 Tax=Paenibacillus senegalensis TaxID=1465766 RepID=UPI000289C989|nr:hypothetical protein [Paenibacillus senegalensis]